MSSSYRYAHIFHAALAAFGLVAGVVEEVFLSLTTVFALVLPRFSVDPRDAVQLDTMAHQAMGETDAVTKIKSFLGRVIGHSRWSGSGFSLTDRLSPA